MAKTTRRPRAQAVLKKKIIELGKLIDAKGLEVDALESTREALESALIDISAPPRPAGS